MASTTIIKQNKRSAASKELSKVLSKNQNRWKLLSQGERMHPLKRNVLHKMLWGKNMK